MTEFCSKSVANSLRSGSHSAQSKDLWAHATRSLSQFTLRSGLSSNVGSLYDDTSRLASNIPSILVVSRIGGTIRDVWITADPQSDLRYNSDEEVLEFRYWSGEQWKGA
jgi:hypothetical protein